MTSIGGMVATDGAPIPRELSDTFSALEQPHFERVQSGWCGESGVLIELDSPTSSARAISAPDAAIAADVRLDNREELIATLDDRCLDSHSTDVEFVLAAFRKWGPMFAGRLRGDFAFLIFDRISKQLIGGRDLLAMRPLYFREFGHRVAFASSISGLKALLPDAAWLPNAPLLRDRIRHEPDHRPNETAFEGVMRVPPGQALIVGTSGLKLERFADFTPATTGELSEADATDGFRHLFTAAVKARLRGTNRPALLVSGGFDSSAIACVAAELGAKEMELVSAVFPETPSADERSYLRMVARKCAGMRLTEVPSDDLWSFTRRPVRPTTEPDVWWTPVRLETLVVRARELGASTVLGGLWGDDALMGGAFSSPAALRALSWPERLQQRRFFSRVGPIRLWGEILGAPILDRWRAARDGHRPRSATIYSELGQIIYRRFTGGRFWSSQARLNDLEHAANMQWRLPFADRQLLEFLMGLPPRFFYKDGIAKKIGREGMRGILPEELRTRRKTTHFTAIAFKALRAEADYVRQICRNSRAVEMGLTSEREVARWLQGLQRPENNSWRLPLVRLIHVETWLRRTLDGAKHGTFAR